jgi:hypothetical protein
MFCNFYGSAFVEEDEIFDLKIVFCIMTMLLASRHFRYSDFLAKIQLSVFKIQHTLLNWLIFQQYGTMPLYLEVNCFNSV